MFVQALTTLLGSNVDPENVPVPRPYDGLSEACNTAALRAMRAQFQLILPSARINDSKSAFDAQREVRICLESLLWVSANQAVIERIIDLVGLICSEYTWSRAPIPADDPARPEIDLQAAETGVLLAWILRKHGSRIDDIDPRVTAYAREQLRRRLFAPVVNHDDYPFMSGENAGSLIILCDILVSALFIERSHQRKAPPVKKLLRLIDKAERNVPGNSVPLPRRLMDTCALADTARILKRLTRGEIDLTGTTPGAAMLDDLLSAYLSDGCFLDPCGRGIESNLSGTDLFRLGYFTGDAELRSLGAYILQNSDTRSATVTGRVLSMEYLQAAFEEKTQPPRLKRAVTSDGMVMLTRCAGFTLAAASCGNRSNAGDITLLFGDYPILCDLGGDVHSLPLIGSAGPLAAPKAYPCEDDFNDSRDLISIDLTESYPPECGINAFQRTLMLSRKSVNIRLVDAFEFMTAPESVTFRFTCACRCTLVHDSIRIGPVSMTWDGDMTPMISDCGEGYLISLTVQRPGSRFICGFSFDLDEEIQG